jgi:hypothetical protein
MQLIAIFNQRNKTKSNTDYDIFTHEKRIFKSLIFFNRICSEIL